MILNIFSNLNDSVILYLANIAQFIQTFSKQNINTKIRQGPLV